jgi:hypothetical protein
MSLGNLVGNFMDWTVQQPFWIGFPAFMGAFAAASGAVLGIAATPFILRTKYNEKAAQRLYADLDNRPTVIFNAASRNTQDMDLESCAVARESALAFAGRLGMGVSYSDKSECAARHMKYEEKVTTHVSTTMVGRVPITRTYTTTSYKPLIVGWQAAKDDPEKAVPLYSGPKPNTGVRQDGKIFALG